MSSNNLFDILSPESDTEPESEPESEPEPENIEEAYEENNEEDWDIVQSKKSNKNNIDTIEENIDRRLKKLYNEYNLECSFETFKEFDAYIFEIFSDENIENFKKYYKETYQIIPFIMWKDIIYLYKLDKEYRNKYIYNLLTLEQRELFKESLKVVENRKNIINTNNFTFITFSSMNIIPNDIVDNQIKNMSKMILTLTDNNNNIDEYFKDILNTETYSKNFGVVIDKKYDFNTIKDMELVKYFDININEKNIILKDYLYYLNTFYRLLFKTNKLTDLNQYLKNEKIGFASNMYEYNYNDYKKLTNILSDLFQDYLQNSQIPDENKLIQNPKEENINDLLNSENKAEEYVGGNFDPHFVNIRNLPICLNEEQQQKVIKIDITDINNIDIDKLYKNNIDFRVNDKWFNKFNEMPCKEKSPETDYIFLPHFTKSVVRKELDNINLLDTETDIINNYLKWYYRPTLLGSVIYLFLDIVKYNNYDNYNTIKVNNIKEIYNPYHFTYYFDKLWMQLQCYNTAPNGFLNEMIDNTQKEIFNNNFYNKYSNMNIQLSHLFPFIFSLYLSTNEKNNYNILNIEVENYYTIPNKMIDYDYLGYIYIPFETDSRLSRPLGKEELTYFIFKSKIDNKIVISNHRNKIYPFAQKESTQLSIVELNIIGYLNKWNKKYEEWTLYPYLVIYNQNYKYYNNLYKLDPDPNYRTHIYISTLKYDELLKKQDELNNRMYNNNNNLEQNLKIQLNIPIQDELNNSNTHMFIIPIIPILMHKTIKFICPNQTEYNIKDYQTFLNNKNNNIIQQGGKQPKSKYFYKYIKYKLKYMNLIYEKQKFQN